MAARRIACPERAGPSHRARHGGGRPLARRARRPHVRSPRARPGRRGRTRAVLAGVVGSAIALGRWPPAADGGRRAAQRALVWGPAAGHRRLAADSPRCRQRRTPVARRPLGGRHRRQPARGGAVPDRRRHAAPARRRTVRSGQLGAVVPRRAARARLRHREGAIAAVLPHRPRRDGLHARHRRRACGPRWRPTARPCCSRWAMAVPESPASGNRGRGRSRRCRPATAL